MACTRPLDHGPCWEKGYPSRRPRKLETPYLWLTAVGRQGSIAKAPKRAPYCGARHKGPSMPRSSYALSADRSLAHWVAGVRQIFSFPAKTLTCAMTWLGVWSSWFCIIAKTSSVVTRAVPVPVSASGSQLQAGGVSRKSVVVHWGVCLLCRKKAAAPMRASTFCANLAHPARFGAARRSPTTFAFCACAVRAS